MKGVILGNGEVLPTPGTDQLQRLLVDSPAERVDLVRIAFKKPPPPGPLFNAEPPRKSDKLSTKLNKENEEPASSSPITALPTRPLPADGVLRPRRPSSAMRLRTGTAPPSSFHTWQPSPSDPRQPLSSIQTGEDVPDHPRAPSEPLWDLNDEENLPSPFLRRVERVNLNGTTAPPPMKPLTQVKSQVSLRTTGASNSAGSSGGSGSGGTSTRTSIGKSAGTKVMRRASSVRLGQAPNEPAPKKAKAFKP
jgi:NIMA (never in mitosis gene a)-related kinase 2